jgi:predicted branched-subunit amino acid permease
MTRREALLLRAFAIWTVWVWGTRISNVVGDDSRSFAFKAIHVVLALISVSFAVATWVVVRRARARTADG